MPTQSFAPIYSLSFRFIAFAFIVLALLPLGLLGHTAAAADRPNIVWIMSEDNSIHYLRHFHPDGAATPRIESLAQNGITFDRAFSNAPVCSVARSTLITSCYAPRIGIQFHRKSIMAAMPENLKMFPAYLRAAGYYTTNNAKEDYNAIKGKDVWDDSSRKASWKNRPDTSTPFFHVLTSTLSHESRLHFSQQDMQSPTKTDPASVQLQPYYPDTEAFRYTRARYHDCMLAIDQVVGSVVDELKQSGELENTFIFYFGDHGGVLPMSKGYAYESGLHVPLIVRVPQRWKALVDRPLGSRSSGFVQFVDFGPTVLRLAGVEVPAAVDGKPFLGAGIAAAEVDARNEAFGYADRFDEKYELVRTLRIGDYKYMRNFEPFYRDSLQNNYRYKMIAFQQFRDLFKAGALNEVQSKFFIPKPVESLYNLQDDPHETRNLAGDPAFANRLLRMRNRLDERLKAMPDLSFMTEAVLYDSAMSNPVAFGQQHQAMIAELIDTANLALLPFEEAKPRLVDAITSDEPLQRYWGLVAASCFQAEAASLEKIANRYLGDEDPLVAMRAAEFLAIATKQDTREPLYAAISKAKTEPQALRLLNTAVYLNDFFGDRMKMDVSKFNLDQSVAGKRDVQNRVAYLSGETN